MIRQPDVDWLDTADKTGARIALLERAPQRSTAISLVFCGGFHSSMHGSKATWLDAYCADNGLGCLRFDYRGHGLSGGDCEQLTLGHWLADLERVLTRVRGDYLLVGSSMGAWLALQALIRGAGRCRALLALAAAPDFTDSLFAERLDETARARLARGETAWIANRYDAMRWPVTPALLDSGRSLSVLEGDGLEAVRCPVRLVHAIDDADVPWQRSLALLERLRQADVRLELLRQGDHRLSDTASLTVIGEVLTTLLAVTGSAG